MTKYKSTEVFLFKDTLTEANLFQKKLTVSVLSQDELALEELALDESACFHLNQIKVNIFLESIRSIKVRLRGQDNMF